VALPHLSNFDDFDPLRQRRGVRLRFERDVARFGHPDLVILPGSKTTIDDLAWLRAAGFAERIAAHRAAGRPVLGVCGGYQMLGRAVRDPAGVESSVTEIAGLGLLPHVTEFREVKRTRQVRAVLQVGAGPFAGLRGVEASGYELRMGDSGVSAAPFARVAENGSAYFDGGCDEDGLVLGTYVHGLLHAPAVREALVAGVAKLAGRTLPPAGPELTIDAALDRWTAHVAAHVDLPRIAGWVGLA
jgi:adenosylcobyric acid synthase